MLPRDADQIGGNYEAYFRVTRRFPWRQKREPAESLGQRLGVATPVRNLLFILINHRRMGVFPDIVDAYSPALDERRRGVCAHSRLLGFAHAGRSTQPSHRKIPPITGRAVEAEFPADEFLLGGSVVRVGGKVYDGSLRSQLAVLDRAMAGEA